MRIVQINETCGIGSTGVTTKELSEGIKLSGNESYVFCVRDIDGFAECIKIGNSFFQKLHALYSRISGMQGYASFIPTLKMVGQLKKIHPDIVHLRNLHSNYINLHILFTFLAKNDIPTVITLHDCWIFTGKCTYYVPASCEKWKKSCGNCPLLHVDNVNPTYFFDRTHKCHTDKRKLMRKIPNIAAVGVSNWITNEAKESFFASKKITTIYNWIDTDTFAPRDVSLLKEKMGFQNKKVVLIVSFFISEIKGYNEMLQLSEILDSSFQIVVVGKNEDNLRIPNNVVHIEQTFDRNHLAQLYSMASVCVNTTKYETFGKVTAESLCCGTPVVVYNNTASPELIQNGCGVVVDEKDGVVAIKKAIELLTDECKEVMQNRCVEYAKDKFDKNRGINSYLRLYEELINDKITL